MRLCWLFLCCTTADLWFLPKLSGYFWSPLAVAQQRSWKTTNHRPINAMALWFVLVVPFSTAFIVTTPYAPFNVKCWTFAAVAYCSFSQDQWCSANQRRQRFGSLGYPSVWFGPSSALPRSSDKGQQYVRSPSQPRHYSLDQTDTATSHNDFQLRYGSPRCCCCPKWSIAKILLPRSCTTHRIEHCVTRPTAKDRVENTQQWQSHHRWIGG